LTQAAAIGNRAQDSILPHGTKEGISFIDLQFRAPEPGRGELI